MKQNAAAETEEITSDEIRKEFQLERMVLFSDAVFAIVITLMAIEIKIPESAKITSSDELSHELKHLLPVILAYIISFGFIGVIWFRHLKLFSRLKDYDTGLVVRNLLLLFFIGLFPFGASLLMKFKGFTQSFTIYFGLVFLTILAQQFLQHYIFVKRPNLRRNVAVHQELMEIKVFNVTLAGFGLSIVSYFCAVHFLPDFEGRMYIVIGCLAATGIVTRLAKRHYLKKLPISK